MKDQSRGLYDKYIVTRTDGSSEPGRKHAHCAYFVLDLHHDKHAFPALLAYAESCDAEYPKLADDLRHFAATHINVPAERRQRGMKP